MDRRYRRGFSAAEKTELWDRWQRGESLRSIGRAFGKPSSSIYFQLAPHGGIRPAPRRRSRLALTLSEREEISRGIVARQSIRSMASLLGRPASTVCREVRRNGGYDGYRAAVADEQAWVRGRRPKLCKLANSPWLRRAVAEKLRLNWSPEQIAGWLKRTQSGDGSYQVSHETIYRSLFVQARGVLKGELLQHLRSKRTNLRSKHIGQKGKGQGQIKDIISIRETRISQTHLGGVSSGADEPGCGSISVALRQSGPGLIVCRVFGRLRRVMGVAARVRERGAAAALESGAAGRARLSREGALQIEVGECELGLPGKARGHGETEPGSIVRGHLPRWPQASAEGDRARPRRHRRHDPRRARRSVLPWQLRQLLLPAALHLLRPVPARRASRGLRNPG